MVRVRRARRTGLQEKPVAGPRHQPGVSRSGGAARQRCCPAPSSTRAFWMPWSRTASASCRSARARESCSVPAIRAKTLSVLHACRGRIVRRQAGGDVVDDGQQAVGVRLPGGVGAAADLVEQGGGRAAVAGVVAVLDRKVFTHVLLDSGAAGRHRAEAFALFAELVGDRGGDQVFLGWEVGVEGAVGQPGVGHERGDPGAVDAVALEPAAGRLDDPLPGRLLVLCPVPHRALLRPPGGPTCPARSHVNTIII